MRFRLADPGSLNYLTPEAWINNIKLLSVNSGTELVVGVGLVDSAGELLTTLPISQKSGSIQDENGVSRNVNRSFVNATGIGNTEIVPAQGGLLKIRVLSIIVVCVLAVTVKFQSATTDIFAGLPFGINGGIAIPYNPHGIMQTAANEALNINLSIGVAVGCNITWHQVT